MRTPRFTIPRRSPVSSAVKKAPALPAKGRFALLIGDEGAILAHIAQSRVQARYFAAQCQPEYVEAFENALAQHPDAPLDVFLDTLDQTYVQQTLPPVSALSTAKLMKRRLDREFSNVPLRGALLLGRESSQRKDWNFLMVAVEQSPPLQEWMDWLPRLSNRCTGIFLLPVESEFFLRWYYQAQSINPAERGWSFIVSHNKVSGFRQIVFRQGKMIFTRLGQPLSDDDPVVAAGVIEQEVSSTLEYLKRLSLRDASALDLIIIAGAEVISAMDRSKLNVGQCYLLSPHEMAQGMRLKDATQASDRFGDMVMASALSASRKRSLRLLTPMLQKLNQLYQLFPLLRGAAALVVLGLLYGVGSSAYHYLAASSSAGDLEDQKRMKTVSYQQLRADAVKYATDVDKLSDMLTIYETLKAESYSPLPFLSLLSQALPADIRIDRLEWQISDPNKAAAAAPAASPPPPPVVSDATAGMDSPYASGSMPVEGKFRVQFGMREGDEQELKAQADMFLATLNTAFKSYEFSYTKLTGITRESERVEIALGQQAAARQPLTAEVAFKGKILLVPDQPSPGKVQEAVP